MATGSFTGSTVSTGAGVEAESSSLVQDEKEKAAKAKSNS